MKDENTTITETKAPDRHDVETIEEIEALLDQRRQEMRAACAPVLSEVQRDLHVFSGMSFDTFEENRRFANAIQRLLTDFGQKVECINSDCEEAAFLRCNKSSTSPQGLFQFEHRINGKQTRHSGRNRLPRLKIVKANQTHGITTKTDTEEEG